MLLKEAISHTLTIDDWSIIQQWLYFGVKMFDIEKRFPEYG